MEKENAHLRERSEAKACRKASEFVGGEVQLYERSEPNEEIKISE